MVQTTPRDRDSEMGSDRGGCVDPRAGTGRLRDRPPAGGGFIAVIESRTFLRECISRSIQSAFSLQVIPYSTLSEFEHQRRDASPELVLLSLTDDGTKGCASALKVLWDQVPGGTIVVLGLADDLEVARIAIRGGARGYIPCTMGFEIAVEALRFILAGGTYVPTACLLPAGRPKPETSQTSYPTSAITGRELAVVRAIQQGKPNKAIANELNLCESTVKVHVRHVMKKMRAKNRTEVAIKAHNILDPIGATVYADVADPGA